jgi:hypothetical protein
VLLVGRVALLLRVVLALLAVGSAAKRTLCSSEYCTRAH